VKVLRILKRRRGLGGLEGVSIGVHRRELMKFIE
jgi:hypothetical protein